MLALSFFTTFAALALKVALQEDSGLFEDQACMVCDDSYIPPSDSRGDPSTRPLDVGV